MLHWNNIIEGCKQQNPQSQETLYRGCYADMIKLCIRYTRDIDEAGAVYNEAMLKVFNTLHQFESRGNFMGWVRRIVVNTCIDQAPNVAQLYRVTDTTGIKLIYETTNPFFYSNLLNQLSANNYLYKLTTAVDKHINLIFSNGKHDMLLDLLNDDHIEPYRITLRPVSLLRTKLPAQYNNNSKIRLNTY